MGVSSDVREASASCGRRELNDGTEPPVEHTDSADWQTAAVQFRKLLLLLFGFESIASAFPSATACACAPRISARNGPATAGAVALPNSKARVVTLRPYIAFRVDIVLADRCAFHGWHYPVAGQLFHESVQKVRLRSLWRRRDGSS